MASRFKRHGKEKFLAIFRHTYRSPAWRALKPVDRALYMVLLTRYDGFNNGRIALSQRDAAADLNVANRKTVAASLKTLDAFGFIKTATPSGFNRKDRIAGVYLLTEYKDDRTGEPPTRDYLKWRPEEKTTGDNFGHGWGQKRTLLPDSEPNSAPFGDRNGHFADSTGDKNGHHIDIHHAGGANDGADTPHGSSSEHVHIPCTNGPRPHTRPPRREEEP